jgi:hypothetical protein
LDRIKHPNHQRKVGRGVLTAPLPIRPCEKAPLYQEVHINATDSIAYPNSVKFAMIREIAIPFINTPLQRGGRTPKRQFNCFNSFATIAFTPRLPETFAGFCFEWENPPWHK